MIAFFIHTTSLYSKQSWTGSCARLKTNPSSSLRPTARRDAQPCSKCSFEVFLFFFLTYPVRGLSDGNEIHYKVKQCDGFVRCGYCSNFLRCFGTWDFRSIICPNLSLSLS